MRPSARAWQDNGIPLRSHSPNGRRAPGPETRGRLLKRRIPGFEVLFCGEYLATEKVTFSPVAEARQRTANSITPGCASAETVARRHGASTVGIRSFSALPTSAVRGSVPSAALDPLPPQETSATASTAIPAVCNLERERIRRRPAPRSGPFPAGHPLILSCCDRATELVGWRPRSWLGSLSNCEGDLG
jgi:hypothetical protein